MVISFYAALLALMYVALSVHVVKGRRQYGVGLGDGGEHGLQRRLRVHGNFAEYTPMFLILFLLAEVNGLSAWALHGLGVIFVAGRVSHAYSVLIDERYEGGKLRGNPRFRIAGMMATFATLTILALLLLYRFVFG